MRKILVLQICVLIAVGSLTAEKAVAQAGSLKIGGDFVLHPAQINEALRIKAEALAAAANWEWPEVGFEKPYKTSWSGVRAQGPFRISMDTEQLTAGSVAFDFQWDNPRVSVGRFAIHDTVVRDLGGIQVVVKLDGICGGMSLSIPSASWRARGTLSWRLVNGEFAVRLEGFEFSSNSAAVPTMDMGQCQGPAEIQQALKSAMTATVADAGAMQDILRRGLLAWVNDSLHSVAAAMLKPRSRAIHEGLTLSWEPQALLELPGGMIRVPGVVGLKRQGSALPPTSVDRTLSDEELSGVPGTGFILPQNALESAISFVQATGDLWRRLKSSEVSGFQSLMQNRFMQMFVWPDLWSFSTQSQFYFDLSFGAAPKLQRPQAGVEGGVVYDAAGPLVVNVFAPTPGRYLNYIDFNAPLRGQLRASVRDQRLTLSMTARDMNLAAKFRPEFLAYRAVNNWMNLSLLLGAARDFINGKEYSAELPEWSLGENLELAYGDLKVYKQNLMLPLSLQKK